MKKTEKDYLLEYLRQATVLTSRIKADMELCIAIREDGLSPVQIAVLQVANNIMVRQAVKIDALEERITSLEDKLREGV